MAYYIKYNEVDLTDIVKVRTVEIPSLPNISHSSVDIFERNGNLYNGASYNEREIKLTFIIKPDDPDDYEMYVNDVKRAFYTKKEAKLYCGDETLYMWCVPVDDTIITELNDSCCEMEVTLLSYDPYWHSTEQQVTNNEDSKTFEVTNEGDVEVYPIISVGFTKNTQFVQIENQNTGERILVGNYPSAGVNGETVTTTASKTKVLDDNMESTTGWVSTSASIDSGRSTGGTLSVTSSGAGLMAGDFGSASSGSTWHGACYKKSLDSAVQDFKVKVYMKHNSTGTNGDPYHPYSNDTETVTSGTKSTYYQVTAKSGLRLRKGAGTSYAKICTIPYGTKLTGTVSKNWLNTTYNGKTGYCHTDYLKTVTSDTTTTATKKNFATTKNTAIRATASKSATNKKTIPAGKCIRCITSTKYPTSGDNKETFYKLAKAYDGVTGYVLISNLIEASSYEVEYDYELVTADDKTGVVELYGFSSNNVQLFKLSMVDDNEWYEFTHPVIRKNNKDFLVDTTVAPADKTRTEYDEDGKTVEKILGGKVGDWNEYYGVLYIERLQDKWYAYCTKIVDGNVTKTIESKTVTDTTNSAEKLSYVVMYVGTMGDTDKASGMAINDIDISSSNKASADTSNVTYNWEEFVAGDILVIDTSVPKIMLNDVEHNELVDVGSQFFKLEPGDNDIKIASDDTPNVDILWNNKYL